MKQRILTALVLLAVLLPIVTINHPLMFILFQLVVLSAVIVGAFEMINMYQKKKKMKMTTKLIIVAMTVFTYLNVGSLIKPLSPNNLPGYTLFALDLQPVVVTSLITVALLSLLVFKDDFNGDDVGISFTIVNYVGLGFAAVTLLRYMGVRFIVYVAIVAVATDVFAYFTGYFFGKHKMAPKISPKKTWEGAIGGTIMGTILASAFALFYGVIFRADGFLGDLLNAHGYMTIFDNFTSLGDQTTLIQAGIIIPITLLGTIAGQIGDLVASKFKRSYQIKDFGSFLPGHGGVLDRFDSILFISLLFTAIFITIQVAYPLS